MDKILFIFRRDLRLEDNTGLLFALKNAKEVVLGFIFTPEQIEHNPYRSDHCLQFMIESLEDLEKEIEKKQGKLYFFFGKSDEIIANCISQIQIDGVIVNRDYTPYSIQRDQKIAALCEKQGIFFHACDDITLHPLEETVKADGKPYTVFTPFYRNALKMEVSVPVKNTYDRYYSQPIAFAKDSSFLKTILKQRSDQQKGGRSEGLKILKAISTFADYPLIRDFPADKGMTRLSGHLKFTTCSPREIYHAIAKQLGEDSELIRSLYWRDFFTSIAFYFPRVFQEPFKAKFKEISWNNDKKAFKRWCDGQTGIPIVDAGMREMNLTGFMHNRVRMIAASFLVKDLHIDWKWGEKYFAQTLIDYDPAVNNGNWQWVASTGCDAQPYFRIFNPWSQAAKFDPEAVYIKRWVPELVSLDAQVIHKWFLDKHHPKCPSYPPPMLDHAVEGKIALKIYQQMAFARLS